MEEEKRVIVVGFDDSEESAFVLQCIHDRHASDPRYKIVIVQAIPPQPNTAEVAIGGEGEEGEVRRNMTSTDSIAEKVKQICSSRSVNVMPHLEVVEGDTTTVFCDIVKKHNAYALAIGHHFCELVGGSGALEGVDLVDAVPCFLFIFNNFHG